MTKKKILIIEDSEPLLNDIVEMISLEGFETFSATNGQIGVEMVAKHNPDLIICDVRMPVMDGYGVLGHLRSSTKTANIPFIFLTARTGRREMREGMRLGADDYLTKPFTADELIASVYTRLDRHDRLIQEAESQLTRLRDSIVLALPHELRTPLNAVLGFSEILMVDAEMLEPRQVYTMAEHINRASLRLYHLVENYLVYANLQVIQTDPERVAMLRQGRAQYPSVIIGQQAEEKARQHNRETDLALDITPVSNDVAIEVENLVRIVKELMDNAFKFSEKDTPITVTVAPHHDEPDALRLTITDQGVGMTEAEIQSIGAYMQFKRKINEQQGVGLGLIIAKQMTELHGGTFDINSVPGEFTAVQLVLPVVSAEA